MTTLVTDDKLLFYVSDIGRINTTVVVDENTVIRAIPPDFKGLTLYIGSESTFIPLAQASDKVKNLFLNLGTSNLRIQGDGEIDYNPTGADNLWPGTINNNFIDTMYSILSQTGWTFTWMINFRDNNASLYAQEAAYVYSKFGSSLLGIEIGNEPDLYTSHSWRTSPYSISTYKTEWLAYYNAIKALNSNIPIVSPSAAMIDWLESFVSANMAQYVDFLTVHYYPANADAPTDYQNPTIQNLLSKTLMKRTDDFLIRCAALQTSSGKDVVINESNSISGGGTDNVSNTMTEAIWAVDHLFNCLTYGVRRVNFQCAFLDTTSFFYNPIAADGTALPLYYGILAFHKAAPSGNLISNSCTTLLNVSSYAVKGSDGSLKVVIVNKDMLYDSYAQITTTNTYTNATAMRLEADSVDSKTVTLGGSAVTANGTWTAEEVYSISISGKVAKVAVPKASVAIVTFT